MLSPQAKHHGKSVRDLPVASVTDGVATKSKQKTSQASFAMRAIPTSSVTIKPRTSYSFSGQSDGSAKHLSVAKPKRAMSLIQAPERKFSGKRIKPVTEVQCKANYAFFHFFMQIFCVHRLAIYFFLYYVVN